jgi:hypothetical protein
MRWLFSVLALSAVAARADGQRQGSESSSPRYIVVPLGSLGGTFSFGNGINDLGWVTGLSALAGDGSVHATLWRGKTPLDLGTLGGPNSAVLWPSKNMIGLIAGVAETAVDQPLQETWSCRFFFPTRTGKTCLGVVWENGQIRPLPTLGGDNGFATSANNRRQVVGWAENTVMDPTCTGRQKLQFHAVLWGPAADQLRELLPLPEDSTSAATGINDRGQAVGISGACGIAVGGVSARRAVRWEPDGSITDLGTLGGEGWNTPMAINAWGDVVGFANAPGTPVTDFVPRPFLWTRARGIEELPLLPGDDNGQALGINVWRHVVGVSCNAGGCRGVLWKGGQVIDLSSHVVTGLVGTIVNAGDIDDLGRIGGQALDPLTNLTTALRMVPVGFPLAEHDR